MTRSVAPNGPDPTGDEPDLPWPSRPAPVELASAMLMVGGAIGMVSTLSIALGPASGADPFLGLTLALDIGSIVVGLLIRLGRFWIVALNYVAVLGFLDLLGAGTSPLALMLGLAEIVVVVILFLHKPWFDALRLRRAAR